MSHVTERWKTLPPVTQEGQRAVAEFLEFALEAVRENHTRIRVINLGEYQPKIEHQIAYWKNGTSILKWLIGINKQRKTVRS